MANEQIHCPQCGAPAPFRGTTVTLVCEYCNSTIVRTGVDVSLVGNVSAIFDNGSPVLLGSRGKHRGAAFEVVGRLQVTYDRGYWNEWALEFSDGRQGWLADALGQFSVTRPVAAAGTGARLPAYDDLPIGSPVQLFGDADPPRSTDAGEAKLFTVTDRRTARYQGSEGVLPFEAKPGCTFSTVDLRNAAGQFATLDYGDDPRSTAPQIFAGNATDIRTMGLTPLREFEGWRV